MILFIVRFGQLIMTCRARLGEKIHPKNELVEKEDDD
jgi:hypothetical protein